MCTASFLSAGDSYSLFFNRDELRTRGAEAPPRRLRRGGIDALAPLDSQAGGTWIGVNELGLAACLLNAYPQSGGDPGRERRSRRFLSRGHLVVGMLDAASGSEVEERLGEGDLRWFQPFRLLALAPGEPAVFAVWDGSRLAVERWRQAQGMTCSSSWDDLEVERSRRALWERLAAAGPQTPAKLSAFHRSHVPERSARSVCMHRDDAETVSHVAITVDPRRVTLRHAPGSPCRVAGDVALELPRRRAPTSSAVPLPAVRRAR